jgi:predicted membrane protein
MQDVVKKTFGGLSAQYYFRQLFFGALFAALIVGVVVNGGNSLQLDLLVMLVVNTLLYPYSRFVYESVVGFIMGDNVFFVNALLMLFVKLMTMALCWSFAIFVAPIGLAYLYYHHSKASAE